MITGFMNEYLNVPKLLVAIISDELFAVMSLFYWSDCNFKQRCQTYREKVQRVSSSCNCPGAAVWLDRSCQSKSTEANLYFKTNRMDATIPVLDHLLCYHSPGFKKVSWHNQVQRIHAKCQVLYIWIAVNSHDMCVHVSWTSAIKSHSTSPWIIPYTHHLTFFWLIRCRSENSIISWLNHFWPIRGQNINLSTEQYSYSTFLAIC